MTLIAHLPRINRPTFDLSRLPDDSPPSAVGLSGVSAALSNLAHLDRALDAVYGSATANPETLADLSAVAITASVWSYPLSTIHRYGHRLSDGVDFLANVHTFQVVRSHINTSGPRPIIARWRTLADELTDSSRPLTSERSMCEVFSSLPSSRADKGMLVGAIKARIGQQFAKYSRVGAELFVKRSALLAFMYRTRFGTPWWDSHVDHVVHGPSRSPLHRLGFEPLPGRVQTLLRHRDQNFDSERFAATAAYSPWEMSEAEAAAFRLCDKGYSPAYDNWIKNLRPTVQTDLDR